MADRAGIVAAADRRIRIEIGYGLEERLTDGTAGQIIRNVMIPRFRNGDYSGGARSGVEAVVAAVRGAYRAPAPQGSSSADIFALWPWALVFIVLAAFTLSERVASARLRRSLALISSPRPVSQRDTSVALGTTDGLGNQERGEDDGPFSNFTLFSDGDSGGSGFSGGGGDSGGGGASGSW